VTHLPARTRRPRRVRAFLFALGALLAAATVLLGAVPADAHAVLVRSSPADGSRLDAAPARVVLTFDEPVQLVDGMTRAFSSSGTRVDTGDISRSGGDTQVVVPLTPDLPRGSYTVSWRVISADTHVVSGSISFGVQQDAASAAATGSAAPTSLDVVAQTAIGLGYVGVVLALGVALLARLLWPDTWRRRRVRLFVRAGGAALLVGALVDLLLQGPRADETGWHGVLRLDGLGETLAGSYGQLLVARIVLAVVGVVLVRSLARRAGFAAYSVAQAGVLVTIALAGHAGVGADVVLAATAAVAHLAAMAAWAGGLLLLLVAVLPGVTGAPDLDRLRLGTWSIIAFVSVAVLVVSGEYQAWREVQPVASLWSTPYGVTLLVKLAFVAIALAGALAAQRMVARRRSGAGADAASVSVVRVRRSLRIEAVAVAAAIVVTSVLTALPPASGTYGPAATVTAPVGDTGATAVAELSTTRHGPLVITVHVTDRNGTRIDPELVTGVLSSPDNGVAGIDVTLTHDGASWVTTDAVVPIAGAWTLQLTVTIDQAHAYATATTFRAW